MGKDSTNENSAGKNGTDKNCADKAENPYASVAPIPVHLGQLEYELAFLQHKVAGRDPEWEHRLSERLAARGELPPVSWTTKLKSKKQEAFHVRASGIKA